MSVPPAGLVSTPCSIALAKVPPLQYSCTAQSHHQAPAGQQPGWHSLGECTTVAVLLYH